MYAVMAPIYDQIGMADLARTMTPDLLTYAQRHDWAGRRILDLGTGTGASAQWFAEHHYNVVALDQSPTILSQAHQALSDHMGYVRLIEADARHLKDRSDLDVLDMVFALGLLPELNNLREIETLFKGVHHHLGDNRYFIFDVPTIRGLTELGTSEDTLIHDESDLVVFRQSAYDFERQACTLHFYAFKGLTDVWMREEARLTSRAYPVQAIATLAKRQGFEIVTVADEDLQPYNLDDTHANRIFFVLRKVNAS